MKPTDPRLWAIKKPRIALLCFLGLTLLFVWGNGRVERGGVLDGDVILRTDDPMRQMDRYVQDKAAEGFEGREVVPFVLNGGGLRSAGGLQHLLHGTETAHGAVGGTALRLSTGPAYPASGEAVVHY